jgi:hypothetical protein
MEGGERMPYAIALAAVGFLVTVYSVAAHYKPVMPKLSVWVALLLLTWMAIGFDYYDHHWHPSIVTVEKTVQEPYQFKWLGDNPPKNQYSGKHFFDERVVLDDSSYIDCTFQSVTFVWNGTAPFVFVNNHMTNGFYFDSDNPAVGLTFNLMYAFGLSKVPMIDKRTGKPPADLKPAQHIPAPR